jgi:molybdopterin-guanine dinucleotide biosynthesis protein A
MRYAGIVLCGGRSSRMGQPKALLPFGTESMLERVVRLLGEAVSPIVVVAAPEQELPKIGGKVQIVRDRHPDRGPLEGLFAGLSALPDEIEAAFVTSCDVPLLVPAFVRRMLDLLGGYEIVVSQTDGRSHPLSAVYRRSVLSHVESLLNRNQLKMTTLFDITRTRYVLADELKCVDPMLCSLENLNRPEDYLRGLERAGVAQSHDQ